MNKKYTWSFMGQVDGRPTRKAMLSELEKLSGEHFQNHNTGWLASDMIEQSEYKRIMADSIFVPCPKGNTSVDCFRFCEALEARSIPIPERGDNYWDKLLGEDHPFYIQANADWKGIANQLESLLSNTKILDAYNKKVSEWWANHKLKLRNKFSNIISYKSEKTLDLNSFNERRKEFSKLSIYNKIEQRDNMWETLIDDERLGKHRKPYDWLSYACSLIPEQEIPEEKFSTFNPCNKIAVVSLHTPEISDFGIYSERSIQEYCEYQDYTFHIYRDKLGESFSPNWSKAQILLNHISNHDYVIWMDSDTLVVDPSKTFEDIIKESSKDILACSDIGGNSKLNSGVVIFKSSDYSKNILNNWHNFEGDKSDLYASGGDQEILVDTISNSDPDFNNVEIFPMDKFNTDPRFATEDSFILHFMAYPHVFKKFFMSYWHK